MGALSSLRNQEHAKWAGSLQESSENIFQSANRFREQGYASGQTFVLGKMSQFFITAWCLVSLALVGRAFLPDPKETGSNAHPTDNFK